MTEAVSSSPAFPETIMRCWQILLMFAVPAGVMADVEMVFSDGSAFVVKDGSVLFGDAANSVLYQPDREGLVIINRDEKSWMSMKPGFADEVARHLAAQVDEMLAGLTPEEQAQVREALPEVYSPEPAETPEFRIERTGQRDVVAGFDCEEAEISGGAGSIDEIVCISTAAELGIAGADYEALTGFMNRLSEIAEMTPDDDSFIDIATLGGIPVRSENIEYGELSELTRIATTGIDSARLEIPPDYQQVALEEVLAR